MNRLSSIVIVAKPLLSSILPDGMGNTLWYGHQKRIKVMRDSADALRVPSSWLRDFDEQPLQPRQETSVTRASLEAHVHLEVMRQFACS